MKKIALLLIVALLLGLSAMAYAGATKYVLDKGPAANPTASGFVIVNFKKLPGPTVEDFGKITVKLQVRGLKTDQDYWVYHREGTGGPFEVMEKVKVNKRGSGHFQGMTDEAWQDPGEVFFYLGIVDDENPNDNNVVLYAKVFWPVVL